MPPPITRPTREGCILVVDVSRAQGERPPWQQIIEADAKAMIVKATDGEDYTDQRWHSNCRAAAEHGLMVGAYHVLRPNHPDGIQQARHFHDVAFDRTALNPILDFEEQDGVPGELCVKRALEFLEETAQLFFKLPMIYCGPGFLAGLHVAPDVLAPLGAYPLWLADYRNAPHMPAPWIDWALWQFDDGTDVRIADVALDLSWWRGTEIELARLGASLG